MGGCMSLDGGPAGSAGRDPGLLPGVRSPPPLSQPQAVFPEDDEFVVKQVLPDARTQALSPPSASDNLQTKYASVGSPVKLRPPGAAADHGVSENKSPSGGLSPLLASVVRSASAREQLPPDGSGWHQPEMMTTTWGRSMGRARSLRDPPFPSHPASEKQQQKAAEPGKETLENPLVSLECFIFL